MYYYMNNKYQFVYSKLAKKNQTVTTTGANWQMKLANNIVYFPQLCEMTQVKSSIVYNEGNIF